jgi:hypothetical protein
MKLLELKQAILNEAALDADGILNRAGRKEVFLNKIKTGSPFITTTGDKVLIAKNEAKRLEGLMNSGQFKGSIKLVLADGGTILLSKLQKTPEFKDFSGKTTADDDSNYVTNKGDISEGLLAAAMFAKLKSRVNKEIGEVTEDDMWAIIDSLTATGDSTYSVNVKDGKSMVNDQIILTVILNAESFSDLTNKAKRSLITDNAASAVRFANSDDLQEFSKYFYLNGRPDIINIICDGGDAAKQKVSKVDIEVVVTDKLTGKVDRKRLDISLKADAAQFGQVGMGSDRLYDFFKRQTEFWQVFGIDIKETESQFDAIFKKKGLQAAVGFVYEFAGDVMATLLSYDNDEDEYMFLSDLAKGINYYATLHNPNVLLVDFVSGGYKMMKFDDIESKLATVKLTTRFASDNVGPQVDVYDQVSGKLFLKFRAKFLRKERRNYVEKGPLMAELLGTKVKRLKK